MHNITALALTFAVCLATTIVVAVLFRVVGRKKTSLLNIVAIPIGITIAEAVRMGWQVSGTAFIFVLAGAVGVSVFCAQLIKVQRGAYHLGQPDAHPATRGSRRLPRALEGAWP